MADEILNKEEWEAAMRTILAAKEAPKKDDGDENNKGKSGKKPPEFFSNKFKKTPAKDLLTEIPTGGGWTPRVGRPDFTKNSVLNEIPNNHPTGTQSPITPADSQKNDTDDNKGIQDEIPAGGGFATRIGKPESKETKLNEIPNNHPAGVGSPRTPIEWDAAGINFGVDTAVGWSTGKPLPSTGKTVWGESPTSNARLGYGNTPADGKTTTDTTNKAPRSSMASQDADSDLGHGADDKKLSLPDGSFFIAQPGDLHAAIAKVQNHDLTNARPQHPQLVEVKRHIARRAADMGMSHEVPADWQMMMALKAEEEIARKFDTEQRHNLSRSGDARPDGSYPIVNMEDLHNAIQAFGRSKTGERASVKAHIIKRARALGAGSDLVKHISGLGNGQN